MTKQEYDSIMKGRKKGFKLMFDRYVGMSLTEPEYYPEDGVLMKGQKPMTEEQAWKEAQKFAEKTDSYCVNIKIVDHNYSPVFGWKLKVIKNDNTKS